MVEERERARELLLELINIPNDERENEILEVLDRIVPDPKYLDYIFQSDEFYDENNNFDIDGLIEKIFNFKSI